MPLSLRAMILSSCCADHGIYEPFVFEWDMKPFAAHQPKISLQSSIGNGVSFLNKNLSMQMFGEGKNGISSLLGFLASFKYDNTSLLLSSRINSISKLRHALLKAQQLLYSYDDDDAISEVGRLDDLGFLPGWGATVGTVCESFQLMLDLIQAPDSNTLESFLSRLPLIFRVVILSPHGYFGQNNVLGLPDTGGQVGSWR